jgi:hypothetical protein
MTNHNIDVQSITHVPSNVTVERPDTGIVSNKVQNDVTLSAGFPVIWISRVNDLGVSPLGIVRTGNSSIPFSSTLSHNPKVMTVEMHWVSEGYNAVKNNADGLALSEVVDVPLRVIGIRGVAEVGEEKQRVAGYS